MHVAQLLDSLLHGPHVEIVKARLPKRPPRLFGKQLALTRIAAFLLGSNARAVRCFTTCITVDGVPTSGSVTSRCTCSGMTT